MLQLPTEKTGHTSHIPESHERTSYQQGQINIFPKMTKGVKFSPPNPRDLLPSNADQEARKVRKELEKEHSYGYKEPILLGLIGLTLFWNMEKQVAKHEERKDKEELENMERVHEREARRRSEKGKPRRDSRKPDDTNRERRRSEGRRGGGGGGGGNDRTAPRDVRDSRSYSRDVRGSRPWYYDDRYEDRHTDHYDDWKRGRSSERRNRRGSF